MAAKMLSPSNAARPLPSLPRPPSPPLHKPSPLSRPETKALRHSRGMESLLALRKDDDKSERAAPDDGKSGRAASSGDERSATIASRTPPGRVATAGDEKGEGAYAPAVAASGRRHLSPPREPCGGVEERREWARTRATKKLPERIGPYTIVDVRGAGTFGRVYEVVGPRAFEVAGTPGTASSSGGCVRRALKVMASEWTPDEGEGAEALAEVATANLRPGHPNLLPVLAQFRYRDAGDGKLRLALVLPLAAGDLHALARRWSALDREIEREEEEEAASIASKGPAGAPSAAWAARRETMRAVVREARLEALLGLWRGMRALNTGGTLHMDIKPQNALLVLREGQTLPPLPLDVDGNAMLPRQALEGFALRAAMQRLAGTAPELGGSWRLSDPGLAVRVGGAHATRRPWERQTSIYRAPSADCGDPRVSERDDWYAFGAMAAAVAFDLRHGPFAPEMDARALARVVREVGFEDDPDVPLSVEAEAVARVVERDRRVPGSAAFLDSLSKRAGGGGGERGRSRLRALRCVRWLQRNALARVDGLAAELARSAVAGDPRALHAAVLRLTGWGPSVLARWRERYWGPAQFDALALFVFMLLQADPRERDASHAGAALSPAAAELDAATAAFCPADPGRRAALSEPLEVRDEPDHDEVFDAVRFARPDTRALAVQLFNTLHGAPAFYAALPLGSPDFAPLLRDTLAALAAKLQQENVAALRLPVRAVVVNGVHYTRGELEDAIGAQLRLHYFGPALQPAADSAAPLFPEEAACARVPALSVPALALDLLPALALVPPPPAPASALLTQAERAHATVRDLLSRLASSRDSPAAVGSRGSPATGSSWGTPAAVGSRDSPATGSSWGTPAAVGSRGGLAAAGDDIPLTPPYAPSPPPPTARSRRAPDLAETRLGSPVAPTVARVPRTMAPPSRASSTSVSQSPRAIRYSGPLAPSPTPGRNRLVRTRALANIPAAALLWSARPSSSVPLPT